jgi:hypothetical protein
VVPTIVPEPTTSALVMIGGGLWGVVARRQKRARRFMD